MITSDKWKPADGLELEPNALIAAIEQEDNQALTAGPGAGKTEMLAQRADFLLRTGQCRYPRRILAISFKRDASLNLKERVRRRCGTNLSSRFDSYTFHAFAKRLIDRFRSVLTGQDVLHPGYTIGGQRVQGAQITLEDLVSLATQILKSSFVARNVVQHTYTDVFLDEFQDCTSHQYQLIKAAFLETDTRLTAVGDTKQKIMGWAGALDGIFESYAQDFNAVSLNLYSNFRAQPQLRRMLNTIVVEIDPASALAEDQIEGEGGEVAIQEYEDSLQEAQALAEQIDYWIKSGVPPHEIAVLVRLWPAHHTEQLRTELSDRGIPVREEQQLQDIATEPIARLIIDYLLSIFGSREPQALHRVMEVIGGIALDDDEEDRLRSEWQRKLHAKRQQVSAPEEETDLFALLWSSAREFLDELGRERLVVLSAEYESQTRLDELIAETRERLGELVANEVDPVAALRLFSEIDAVRIMTVHKAKGLEFDSVVFLGIENESFFGSQDEALSVFFVGISRAKRQLVLTTAKDRQSGLGFPNSWRESRTSQERFLGYARPFAVHDG